MSALRATAMPEQRERIRERFASVTLQRVQARTVQRGPRMEIIAPEIESSIYNYMLRCHRYLEDQYGRVLEALAIGSPELRKLWAGLEQDLLAHMEAEERYVLPAFARFDRVEALELLREHGQVRELLLELGVAIDLHAARFEGARHFIDTLRAHAAHEQKLLYQWSDEQLETQLANAAMKHATTS